jgi:type IV fimbrial biogenesis protein FimT
MKNYGFTLFELIISLSILSLLMTIGIPSFSSQIKATQLRTSTDNLLESVNLARTAAVMKNTRVTMRNLGDWNKGWEIFIDTNENGVRDPSEALIHTQSNANNINLTPNTPLANYISFIGTGESRLAKNNNGGALQMGTIKICPESGGGNSLVLSRVGRPKILTLSATDCAQI